MKVSRTPKASSAVLAAALIAGGALAGCHKETNAAANGANTAPANGGAVNEGMGGGGG
jgi:hypothetical protein